LPADSQVLFDYVDRGGRVLRQGFDQINVSMKVCETVGLIPISYNVVHIEVDIQLLVRFAHEFVIDQIAQRFVELTVVTDVFLEINRLLFISIRMESIIFRSSESRDPSIVE
jgi:hypothetical protein